MCEVEWFCHRPAENRLSMRPVHALDAVPLFPLPGHVLLPGLPVPFLIFEPRYRALVSDPVSYTHLTLPTNREV